MKKIFNKQSQSNHLLRGSAVGLIAFAFTQSLPIFLATVAAVHFVSSVYSYRVKKADFKTSVG